MPGPAGRQLCSAVLLSARVHCGQAALLRQALLPPQTMLTMPIMPLAPHLKLLLEHFSQVPPVTEPNHVCLSLSPIPFLSPSATGGASPDGRQLMTAWVGSQNTGFCCDMAPRDQPHWWGWAAAGAAPSAGTVTGTSASLTDPAFLWLARRVPPNAAALVLTASLLPN